MRTLSLILAALLVLPSLAACGSNPPAARDPSVSTSKARAAQDELSREAEKVK